eukprot:6602284-Pyramimonas_sp.AAC.1
MAEERGRVSRRTLGPMKQKVRDAHILGPVPPHIEAIRKERERASVHCRIYGRPDFGIVERPQLS